MNTSPNPNPQNEEFSGLIHWLDNEAKSIKMNFDRFLIDADDADQHTFMFIKPVRIDNRYGLGYAALVLPIRGSNVDEANQMQPKIFFLPKMLEDILKAVPFSVFSLQFKGMKTSASGYEYKNYDIVSHGVPNQKSNSLLSLLDAETTVNVESETLELGD